MKNFNYNVNTYCADGDEMTLRTNSIKSALDAFYASVEDGHHTDIVNGFTGEVLAIANTDEPWCTDEMALMILGYLCAETWGEEDEDDEPIDPAVALIASLLGIPADEVVALHNGEGLPS